MDWRRILVVDDRQVILLLTRNVLEKAGYEVWTAVSGQDALNLIKKKGLPHLAIVDINMPNMDGFQFCRKLHQFSAVPVIMLSAESGEETVVKGLDAYAEDYIVKPTNGPIRAAELTARVRTVLNRMGDFAYTFDPIIRIDNRLQVNLAGRKTIVNGQEVSLTPTETRLFYLLLHHAGRSLTNDYLLRRLWPLEEVYEERLHTHVYRLRKKIEANPKKPHYIISEWGRGYNFPALPSA